MFECDGGDARALAGTFQFQARDGQGNLLTTGGAQIEVYALIQGGTPPGILGTVVDHGNGTYTISYLPLEGGTYE